MDRRADHVYIGSAGPRPILNIYMMSKLFGRHAEQTSRVKLLIYSVNVGFVLGWFFSLFYMFLFSLTGLLISVN